MKTSKNPNNFTQIRIYLTERCNQKCPSCFNAKERRAGQEMDVAKLIGLLGVLKEWGYKRIAIMGGEPLLHSGFSKVFSMAQKKIPGVAVFTNGTVPIPEDIRPRTNDAFIFNFLFAKNKVFLGNLRQIIEKKWLNRISMEVVVRSSSNIQAMKKNMSAVNRLFSKRDLSLPRPFFTFSFDCTANIFADKQRLNEMMIELLLFARSQGMSIGSDHNPPYCFVGQKLRRIAKALRIFRTYKCSLRSAGLITSDFGIQFCGVYPRSIGNLYKKDGSVIEFSTLVRRLKRVHKLKLEERRQEMCRECRYWKKECNGACFPYASPRK